MTIPYSSPGPEGLPRISRRFNAGKGARHWPSAPENPNLLIVIRRSDPRHGGIALLTQSNWDTRNVVRLTIHRKRLNPLRVVLKQSSAGGQRTKGPNRMTKGKMRNQSGMNRHQNLQRKIAPGSNRNPHRLFSADQENPTNSDLLRLNQSFKKNSVT
jgi:hypothetical protein